MFWPSIYRIRRLLASWNPRFRSSGSYIARSRRLPSFRASSPFPRPRRRPRISTYGASIPPAPLHHAVGSAPLLPFPYQRRRPSAFAGYPCRRHRPSSTLPRRRRCLGTSTGSPCRQPLRAGCILATTMSTTTKWRYCNTLVTHTTMCSKAISW
jgi:hypothetical protein